MDAGFRAVLPKLEQNPNDDIAWQQFKRIVKKDPEASYCELFFGHLAECPAPSPLELLFVERWPEVFTDLISFYRAFLSRTRAYGDIWGGGQELWQLAQFFVIWAQQIQAQLPPGKRNSLEQVLSELHRLTEQNRIPVESNQPGLPFLPQEVAWNLQLYLDSASVLADYPQFRHIYFMPAEIAPLSADLEQYRLSPDNRTYLQKLLHTTRQGAIKTALLHFAQTYPPNSPGQVGLCPVFILAARAGVEQPPVYLAPSGQQLLGIPFV
ncbi:MAG TPA: hypothetical protein VHQ46_04445 [Desulfobacteria bacterium]|nr:hypothetical protein [Desulfobacteria bacterium]